MPVCRTCGKGWPDDHAVCPNDGTKLKPPSSMTVGSIAPALAVAAGLDDDLAPGSFAGDYRIEKKIGQGGMGAVYGAKHPVIGKRAAIKVIRRDLSSNAEAVERFVLEAQAVNTIGHPNIVDVFAFGALEDGRSFFAMEWLQGESLASRLTRPIRMAEACEILDVIAKALLAAHEAGVVHRDLKPDNVYLAAIKGELPQVKLLDFGLAKLSGSESRIDRTRTGVVMGTPMYLSPEQAKGVRVGAATDVYSLGVIAYEMFGGRVPFSADSAVEIMSKHITDVPVPLAHVVPEIPPEIDALVIAMLAKDPTRRPTLADVRDRLGAARTRDLGSLGSAANFAPPSQFPQTPATGVPIARPATGPIGPSALETTTPPPLARSPETPSLARRMVIALVLVLLAGIASGVAVYSLRGTGGDDQMPVATAIDAAESADAHVVAVNVPRSDAPVARAPDVSVPDPRVSDTGSNDPPPDRPVTPPRPPTLGTVIVKITGPAHAKVVVDRGVLVRQFQGGTTLELAPGKHMLVVRAPKYEPDRRQIFVGAGTRQVIRITLRKKHDVNAAQDPFGTSD